MRRLSHSLCDSELRQDPDCAGVGALSTRRKETGTKTAATQGRLPASGQDSHQDASSCGPFLGVKALEEVSPTSSLGAAFTPTALCRVPALGGQLAVGGGEEMGGAPGLPGPEAWGREGHPPQEKACGPAVWNPDSFTPTHSVC